MKLWPFVLVLTLSAQIIFAKPAYFTENRGQIDPSVLFYHKSHSQNILLFRDGFAYDNYMKEGEKWVHHRAEIRFQNFNTIKSIERIQPLGFYENFYQENREVLNVRSFETIVFKDVYEHIDLRFLFNESGRFKYDVIVHPGGDVSNIDFKVEGAPVILKNNQLIFELSFGRLQESIPVSYIAETMKEVHIGYINKGESQFGFSGFSSSKNQTLVIDPVPNLMWGTYYGGTSPDESYSSTIDSFGFIYQTGKTQSNNNISTTGTFQTTLGGNYDGYISKFDSSGKLIWATYYGGSSYEDMKRIKINRNHEIVVIGNTTGASGLATNGAYKTVNSGSYDGLVMKFSNTGNRIWATYFGGSSIDEIYRLEIDEHLNIYVGGKSLSSGLATAGAYKTNNSGGEDGLLFSFTNNGSLRWCTYFGGPNQDYVWDMVSHSDKFIYFTGHTFSATDVAFNAKYQSTYGGGGDVYFAKTDTLGKIYYVNYFGGTGLEYPIELATDGKNMFHVGHTSSSSNISTSGAFKQSYSGNTDGYLFSFDQEGNVKWATYIGGSEFDEIYAIKFYKNRLFLAGKTNSSTGISTADAFQKNIGGGSDNFIMQLDLNGQVKWGTYYGGAGNDRVTSLETFHRSIYLSGATNSSSNIATSGVHKSNYSGGGEDPYLARFDNLGCGFDIYVAVIKPVFCEKDSSGIGALMISDKSAFTTVQWKTTPPQFKDTAIGLTVGTYEVVISDENGCKDSIQVTIPKEELKTYSDIQVCEGSSIRINGNEIKATGVYSDTVQSIIGCDSIVVFNVTVVKQIEQVINQFICQGEMYIFGTQKLNLTGTYSDTLKSFQGCDSMVTLNLVVLGTDSFKMKSRACSGRPYYFNQVKIDTSGLYYFKERSFKGCDSIIVLQVDMFDCDGCLTPWIPNAFSPVKDGLNDDFKPIGNCPYMSYEFMIFNRWGEILFKSSDPLEAWDGNYLGVPCCQSVYGWKLIYSYEFQTERLRYGTVHLLRNGEP